MTRDELLAALQNHYAVAKREYEEALRAAALSPDTAEFERITSLEDQMHRLGILEAKIYTNIAAG